jgi:hypothetical protein
MPWVKKCLISAHTGICGDTNTSICPHSGRYVTAVRHWYTLNS